MTALKRRWLVCWVVLPRSCNASDSFGRCVRVFAAEWFLICSDGGCGRRFDNSIDVRRPGLIERAIRVRSNFDPIVTIASVVV
jgi:hypothetical protein